MYNILCYINIGNIFIHYILYINNKSLTNLGIIHIDKTKYIYYNKNIQKLTKYQKDILLSRL